MDWKSGSFSIVTSEGEKTVTGLVSDVFGVYDVGGVPSENPIRRRNSRVWPNRGKVGACVMPYDFCP